MKAAIFAERSKNPERPISLVIGGITIDIPLLESMALLASLASQVGLVYIAEKQKAEEQNPFALPEMKVEAAS